MEYVGVVFICAKCVVTFVFSIMGTSTNLLLLKLIFDPSVTVTCMEVHPCPRKLSSTSQLAIV